MIDHIVKLRCIVLLAATTWCYAIAVLVVYVLPALIHA